jgi:hypothetical protein
LAHLRARPYALVAAGATSLLTEENEHEVRASGTFGDKPLLVLTAGLPQPAPPRFASEIATYQEVWKHEMQPQLARLSSRGRQVILEEATHAMPFEMPDIVVNAIREVIDECRLDGTTGMAE